MWRPNTQRKACLPPSSVVAHLITDTCLLINDLRFSARRLSQAIERHLPE